MRGKSLLNEKAIIILIVILTVIRTELPHLPDVVNFNLQL